MHPEQEPARNAETNYYRVTLKKPDGRLMSLYSRKPIANHLIATNPRHDPILGSSHLRWHPLRGEWVAYASHRQNRTFLPPKEFNPLAPSASSEFPTELPVGDYDIAVFENLFPSLAPDSAAHAYPSLFVPTAPGEGVCEVVVFTQDADQSLGRLPLDHIELLLRVWGNRTSEIGARPGIEYVLPFENRGVEVGVTLHHPHGQIYSYSFVPPIPARMVQTQKDYLVENGRVLLDDLIKSEIREQSRMIAEDAEAAAFIPVCARYPYEVWVAPLRPVAWLSDLTNSEIKSLSRVLKTVLLKFDHLWNRPFPYLLALYQAPTDGAEHPEFHMHFEFYPPYRSRDRLKYLAGTELAAGMFVNDALPEEKAAELRNVKLGDEFR